MMLPKAGKGNLRGAIQMDHCERRAGVVKRIARRLMGAVFDSISNFKARREAAPQTVL